MAIPALNEDGLLPEGIHDCTPEEAKARFGNFQGSDRRPQLWVRLEEFLAEVMACGMVEAVVLNGSFVTGKPEPNDIDLILVVRADHDFSADLTPSEYNVLSKRRVFQRHRFDLLVARAGSEEFRRYALFFQQVRLEVGKRKGILRLAV
jgi:predicted nucleotidyltransferase